MPKRTNYFQTLLLHIYEQLIPVGAVVTESAMLRERSSNVEREVDILVAHTIAGHTINIGIECRDRSSKDDITWVDGILGKYKDLNIHKIILVSNSGFSEGALKKATMHNIECHTLEKFNSVNLYEKLNSLRMSFISRTDCIQEVVLTTVPSRADEVLDPALAVYEFSGKVIGNLVSIITHCYNNYVKGHITSHLNQNMNSILPSGLIFDHEETFTVPVTFPEPYLYFLNPNAYYITRAQISVQCKFISREKTTDNYWYNNHHIVVAHLDNNKKILVVQKLESRNG
ncbi:MAG: hypothetical protein R3C14_50660 [Caldilineaceae bacterium]